MRGLTGRLGLALALASGLIATPVAAEPDVEQGTDSFSFVVIGHVRGDGNGQLNPWFDAILDDVRNLEPDLVFLTGDLIWGDYHSSSVDGEAIAADWNQLDEALTTLGVPVYRVPGNHDINDPTTREIYRERYGLLPQRIDRGNVRFLLLNSTDVGEPDADGNMPVPREYIGGTQIGAEQIGFLERELAAEPAPTHAFVFLHHTLWWNNGDPWWSEVHPVLSGSPVRAVFGGDYGPMKYSHLNRDGIDYIQSSIEGMPSNEILGIREASRLLTQQFDNVLHVKVDGDQVRIDVRPVAAMVSGKFSPSFRKSLWDYSPPWQYRARKLLNRPKLLIAGGGGLLAMFVTGLMAGRFLLGGKRA